MAKITKQTKFFVDNQPISEISVGELWAEGRYLVKLQDENGCWAVDEKDNFMIYVPQDLIRYKLQVLPLNVGHDTLYDLEEFFNFYRELNPLNYDVIYKETY